MKEIERRIYISEEILNNEYSYAYGENKNKEVTFTFYQVKTGKETTGIWNNYSEALALARYKANDKRYRNYEFLIDVAD